MDYHHGYFMGLGLLMFLAGFLLQFYFRPDVLALGSFQFLTVLGALILGWGTGRCDQCSVQEK